MGALNAVLLGAVLLGCAPVRPAPPMSGEPMPGLPVARLKPGTPWTGWDDAREPLVAFSSVRGWTATTETDSPVQLERVKAPTPQQLSYARLVAATRQPVARVLLRPPAPLAIPEPFDSVEIRLGADDAMPDETPRPSILVRIQTAEGAIRDIPLGPFPRRGWRLAHRRLPDEKPLTGARLIALEVRDWSRPADMPLSLAGLTFYTQSRAPIVAPWRRALPDERPIALLALAQEPDRHPFFALPEATEIARKITADFARRTAEFVWVEKGRRLAYRVHCADAELRVEVAADGAVLGAFDDLRWPVEPDSERPTRCLAMGRYDERTIAVEFEDGRRATISLRGQSLVIECAAEHRDIAWMETPVWTGGAPLAVAFLNAAPWEGPPVWSAESPDGTFVGIATVWPDPEYSRATRWRRTPAEAARRGPVWRAEYEAPAGGRRVPIRERLILTVTPDFEHAWPRMGRSDAPVAPSATPDHSPVVRVDADRLAPSHPGWARDLLRRDFDGQWVETEDHAFAVKWPMLPLVNAAVLPAADAAADEPVRWLAALSSEPPWSGSDGDARVPDGATYAHAWFAWRAWLREIRQKSGRPVMGFDDWIWLHAPALDVWDVRRDHATFLLREPLPPQFSLLRLKPIGEGRLPAPEADADAEWDRWMAALIWYGLAPGTGADAVLAPAERARQWIAELLRRTAGKRPERIAFGAAWRDLSPSVAPVMGGDLLPSRARLYLRYAPSLEIWINRDENAPWEITIGGETWMLPPHGIAARDEGLFVVSERTAAGGRAHYREHGREWFLDPRGEFVRIRGLGADGAVVVQAASPGTEEDWNLRMLSNVRRLALRVAGTPAAVQIERSDSTEPEDLAPDRIQRQGEWLEMDLPEKVTRLRFRLVGASALRDPLGFSSPAAPGSF